MTSSQLYKDQVDCNCSETDIKWMNFEKKKENTATKPLKENPTLLVKKTKLK